jgi:hypothetical protein
VSELDGYGSVGIEEPEGEVHGVHGHGGLDHDRCDEWEASCIVCPTTQCITYRRPAHWRQHARTRIAKKLLRRDGWSEGSDGWRCPRHPEETPDADR